MQSSNRPSSLASSSAVPASGVADREVVADHLAAAGQMEKTALAALMEDPRQDETLLAGLELHMNRQTKARFLHTMKLEALGEWLGQSAPARLQVRLMEIAKSSHHPAYEAFRAGVLKSGGLERAYPKA